MGARPRVESRFFRQVKRYIDDVLDFATARFSDSAEMNVAGTSVPKGRRLARIASLVRARNSLAAPPLVTF